MTQLVQRCPIDGSRLLPLPASSSVRLHTSEPATDLEVDVETLQSDLTFKCERGSHIVVVADVPDAQRQGKAARLNLQAPILIRSRTTVEAVMDVVCTHYKITRADLLRQSYNADERAARRAAVYLIRENTSLSFASIGQTLGGRSHTQVRRLYRGLKEELHRNRGDARRTMYLILEQCKVEVRKREQATVVSPTVLVGMRDNR